MRFDSKDSSELAKKQLALDLDLQNHIPRPHVDLENDGLGRDYRKHILATNRVDTSMLDHRSAVVINIWRVQNGSLRHPLIVLGRRAIQHNPRVIVFNQGTDNEFSAFASHHADDQWFYLSNMGPNDALAFVQYDEQSIDRGRLIHCAADHTPTVFQARNEPRISIESRNLTYKYLPKYLPVTG